MNGQRFASGDGGRMALGILLVVLTAACWWGWMAWDHTYRIESGTGTANGPYQVWQVAGCVLCLTILAVVRTTRLWWWLVTAIMSITFTAAWSGTAAGADQTGLWGVAAVLVFVGMLAGTG